MADRNLSKTDTPITTHSPIAGLINRLIDRIDNAAALPDDPAPVRLQKTLLIFLCAAGFLIIPWGAYYLYQQDMQMPALVISCHASISMLALLHLLTTRRPALSTKLQLTALLATPFLIQWTMGGFQHSGSAILWALLSPLCALALLGPQAAIAWFAAYLVAIIVSAGHDIALGAPQLQTMLYSENVLLVSTLAFIALRFFVIEREKAQRALELEHARAEALLLNILPSPIAERLKKSHQTIADGYAEATILFADIVGFTKLSTTISPEQLVNLLNQLFSRFDELSGQFGVEKIKTIGDAYMACAGVPLARPDHAEAIADLALAMQETVDDYNRVYGSSFQIRIGINTGPVVAGVIGLKKFIYDLWGDTVNLASRMESNGLPGCIQVSSSTWKKLQSNYRLKARGKIDIKGIGEVESYLLKGKVGSPVT